MYHWSIKVWIHAFLAIWSSFQVGAAFLGHPPNTQLLAMHVPIMKRTSQLQLSFLSNPNHRRDVITWIPWTFIIVSLPYLISDSAHGYAGPMIDVNNAVAREYTAFPGLYPTIAAKLVNAAKEKPFTNKAQVYEALDNDIQRERLHQYDAAIFIASPDTSVRQFKESQICKFECKGRVSARQ